MRYTQLDFVSYSPKRRTLFQQAQFLLHELVAGRIHEHPCNCGVCIYAAYRKSKKAEGRSFSKRTFFVFYLRSDFFMAVWTDKRLLRYDSIRKIGSNRWKNAVSKYIDMKTFFIKEPNFLIDPKSDIYFDRVMSITRRRTLGMIKKLLQNEKSQGARKFLSGILRKKCFYTYYKRTGDEALSAIINKNQQSILSPYFDRGL